MKYTPLDIELGYPSDCRYGLELTRSTSLYNEVENAQAYRMQVEVTEWNGLDPNIFVYTVYTPDASTGQEAYAVFSRIASPNDLEELPAGAPTTETAGQEYRMAGADLLFRGVERLEEMWALIQEDRDELIRTLTYLCTAEPDIISTYGDLDESSSSSSVGG